MTGNANANLDDFLAGLRFPDLDRVAHAASLNEGNPNQAETTVQGLVNAERAFRDSSAAVSYASEEETLQLHQLVSRIASRVPADDANAPVADDDANAPVADDDANAPVADDGNIDLPENGVPLSVLRMVEPPANFEIRSNNLSGGGAIWALTFGSAPGPAVTPGRSRAAQPLVATSGRTTLVVELLPGTAVGRVVVKRVFPEKMKAYTT
ncbi:hypothetical protein F4821DRAFT_252951 [Hypoxylon rubiginosum]|uniref:Uncharacterized protein n=1 Tax=Hypoxylon rubiginosum TaxID=110542 RepID=A0ACC0DMD9_9PEZI|nr:hypothetical protein F4821DRAFT_252951 [Hypoxylon rubiginosum]